MHRQLKDKFFAFNFQKDNFDKVKLVPKRRI